MIGNLYVCGFLFHAGDVLLTQKTRPPWQAGRLNGVGGRIEAGETVLEAMHREHQEETKHYHPEVVGWQEYCVEHGPDYAVHFCRLRVSDSLPRPRVPVGNDVGELIGWVSIAKLMRGDYMRDSQPIGNLYWLIPLALDPRALDVGVSTPDAISARPSWPAPGAAR